MMSRLFAITGWLAAGHAALLALFWLLLSIPESNVLMLVASALTIVLMACLSGWIEAIGLLAWSGAGPARELARRAVHAVPGVWIGAALCGGVWYLADHSGAWWRGHAGEIDGWLMASFGWAETAKLHSAMGWLLAFVRFMGFSLAVSLSSAVVTEGFGALRHARWIRDAVSPRRLLVLAAILFALVWLPWRGVNWRPVWLAPTWQEAMFVGVKLGVLYLLANVGWALLLGVNLLRHPRRQ
jgi:hypothetical protein